MVHTCLSLRVATTCGKIASCAALLGGPDCPGPPGAEVLGEPELDTSDVYTAMPTLVFELWMLIWGVTTTLGVLAAPARPTRRKSAMALIALLPASTIAGLVVFVAACDAGLIASTFAHGLLTHTALGLVMPVCVLAGPVGLAASSRLMTVGSGGAWFEVARAGQAVCWLAGVAVSALTVVLI